MVLVDEFQYVVVVIVLVEGFQCYSCNGVG